MWFFLAASVLFPLIDSAWSSPGLLPETLLRPPSAPCRISEKHIREQESYYRLMRDPAIRSRIALTFRQANDPAALPVLRSLLTIEKDLRLQADLITSYRILAETLNDVSGIREDFPYPFLLSESAAVRMEAARILIQAGTGGPEIAEMLKKNDSPFLAETILGRLADSTLRLPAETAAVLAASADPRIRNSALKYLARTSQAPDSEKILADARTRAEKEKDLPALLALTEGLAANPVKKCPAMLEKLVRSDLLPPGARFTAASMSPADSVRTGLLLFLLNDPSSAVRAAAARSLAGAEPSEKRTEALGKRLRDEARPVREAAAGSLAAKTGPELSRTVLSSADDRKALGPLLTVIRASGSKKYAPLTAEILKTARKEKDSVLLCQAVDTLSALRAESLVPLILECAADKDETVRAAVAASLRVFPGSATSSALIKLVRDPSENVAISAMESVRILNDASFTKELVKAAGSFRRSSDFRSYACRALGNMTDRLDSDDIRTLRKLILSPCISVPMSPPMYDEPLPRALGLCLLLKGSRAGNPLCREAFASTLEHLRNPGIREKENGICDGLMEEYVRQIRLMSEGKEVVPASVPEPEPEFTIYGNHDTKQ